MKNIPKKRVLMIDVGGTNIKLQTNGQTEEVKIPSGPTMTPGRMVRDVKRVTKDWAYDVISIGYPGPVIHDRPLHEPHNLGVGWMGFDFAKAFGYPVRVINDAAMQALGSYKGGRMLFLGLGTGLGSAMIADGTLEPMELAHLPYKNGKTFEDYVGLRGLERAGEKEVAASCGRRGRTAQDRSSRRLRGAGRWERENRQNAAAGDPPGRQPQRLRRRLAFVGVKPLASGVRSPEPFQRTVGRTPWSAADALVGPGYNRIAGPGGPARTRRPPYI